MPVLCRLNSIVIYTYQEVFHLLTVSTYSTNTRFTRHSTFFVPASAAHLRHLFRRVLEGVKSTGYFYRFLPQSLNRLPYPCELYTLSSWQYFSHCLPSAPSASIYFSKQFSLKIKLFICNIFRNFLYMLYLASDNCST